MELDIRPLTGETWPALAALFEEGGDPRWCWCQFWRTSGFGANANEVRDANRALLRAQADRPLAPGLVALTADGAAVGWVSLGPREDFEHLERSRVRPRLDDVPGLVDRLLRGRPAGQAAGRRWAAP